MREACVVIADVPSELPQSWRRMTPAKRRILEFLLKNGGEVRFWPGTVLMSMRPLTQMRLLGWVDDISLPSDKYTRSRLTDLGRRVCRKAGIRV